MAIKSNIEWTGATLNPVAGCKMVSPGCTNCYAMPLAARLEAMGQEKYTDLTIKTGGKRKWNGKLHLDYKSLENPKKWKKPRMIFLNSMSDLFYEDVAVDFIDQVFDTMEGADHHVYQVLTKRAAAMQNYVRKRYGKGNVPKHIWLGVSVESRDYVNRIKHLQKINTESRFISFEPLLGSVGNVDLKGIAWAIVGGESGPRFRPVKKEWITELRDTCDQQGVEFFFKQWGGFRAKSGGRLLDGVYHNGFPWHLMSGELKRLTQAKFDT